MDITIAPSIMYTQVPIFVTKLCGKIINTTLKKNMLPQFIFYIQIEYFLLKLFETSNGTSKKLS